MNDIEKQHIDITDMDAGLKMYSDYKMKKKSKKNTFQVQGLVNEVGSAHLFPSEAFGLGVREDQEDHNVLVGNNQPKTISVDDDYTQIEIQGKLRIGKKIIRSYLYISLMRDTDYKYSIKLSGTPTTAIWEIVSEAQDNQYVLNIINNLKSRNLSRLMIGRLRYKGKKKYTTVFHKRNIKSALAAFYLEDDNLVCELFIFDKTYKIICNKELTEKQIPNYDFAGIFKKKLLEI